MKKILFFFSILLAYSSSWADKIPWQEAIRGSRHDPKFQIYLPTICKKKTKYHKQFHNDMVWSNHYCDSKAKIHICLKYMGKSRYDCINQLRTSFKYWLERISTPNFPLFPYIYTEHGNFFMEMNEYSKAAKEYLKAIKKNRKYVPAYIKLTDAFIKLKRYDDAEKVINKAAKLKPNSKAVIRRIQILKEKKHNITE